MTDVVELTGTVEDVFAHRFTLNTDEGKKLVDLGPGGERELALSAGQTVGVKGEDKPGEFRVKEVRVADGEWQPVKSGDKHPPKPPHDKGHEHGDAKGDEAELTDEHVTKLLDEEGYSDHAERIRKPRHVEVVATKDGQHHKLHVHKDGVKKTEPVD
jgi:hypothetical protein